MINDNYQLRYLPIFFDDVNSIASYIKNELSNPKAANDLIDAIEEAILKRLPVCESFEPYQSKRERKNMYYRIYVKNYVIYYVVIEDESSGKKSIGFATLFLSEKYLNLPFSNTQFPEFVWVGQRGGCFQKGFDRNVSELGWADLRCLCCFAERRTKCA